MLDPRNWFWFVGGGREQVWSSYAAHHGGSFAAGWLPADHTEHVSFLASANITSISSSLDDLKNVMRERAPGYISGLLTLADYQTAVEQHVDAVARGRDYSSAVSLASYVSSTMPLWRAEAQAFVAWRDKVWAYALAELEKVQIGQREAPDTVEAFIEELPVIAWPGA